MAEMIRKQIYVRKQQQQLLKRLAKARGVSQAEIIRQALDEQLGARVQPRLVRDPSALEAVLRSALARRRHGTAGARYEWDREALYLDRTPLPPAPDR